MILLNGCLTAQPPTLGGIATGKEGFFGGQHGTAALFDEMHLHWAQVPPPPQAAGKEQIGSDSVCSSLPPAGTVNGPLTIDLDTDITAG